MSSMIKSFKNLSIGSSHTHQYFGCGLSTLCFYFDAVFGFTPFNILATSSYNCLKQFFSNKF